MCGGRGVLYRVLRAAVAPGRSRRLEGGGNGGWAAGVGHRFPRAVEPRVSRAPVARGGLLLFFSLFCFLFLRLCFRVPVAARHCAVRRWRVFVPCVAGGKGFSVMTMFKRWLDAITDTAI